MMFVSEYLPVYKSNHLPNFIKVPSRLKEALKAAKESLEKRLQEEQRLVRHYFQNL